MANILIVLERTRGMDTISSSGDVAEILLDGHVWASGGSTTGFAWEAHVELDANAETINAACIAAASAIIVGESIPIDGLRFVGGTLAKL